MDKLAEAEDAGQAVPYGHLLRKGNYFNAPRDIKAGFTVWRKS